MGFLDVKQICVHTSEGNVGLPILYKKTAALTALFKVPLGAMNSLLQGTGLSAAPAGSDSALAAVVFFRYDETSIGPYNEAALATIVTQEGHAAPAVPLVDISLPPALRRSAIHILDLPVTTAIANAAGREIWGYPKFVTEIPITMEKGHFEGRVKDPEGTEIVEMSGSLGPGLPIPAADMVLLSHLHGELVRARIDIKASMRAHRGSGLTLTIGASSHPMAQRLSTLGLDGQSPMLLQVTNSFRSRLHIGERLATPW